MRLILRRIDEQNAPRERVGTHRCHKRQARKAGLEHLCKLCRQIRRPIAPPPA